MTEGISKERLVCWFDLLADKGRLTELEMVRTLIDECTELDPWLPIDENTPKDKPILLLLDRGIAVTGYWSCYHWVSDIFDEFDCSNAVSATHYKLLPEDPK